MVLADYESVATGEISAKAGDIVNLIKKEETGWLKLCKNFTCRHSKFADSGWCLVTRKVDKREAYGMEEIGYISADYLKPYMGWAHHSPALLSLLLHDQQNPDTPGCQNSLPQRVLTSRSIWVLLVMKQQRQQSR